MIAAASRGSEKRNRGDACDERASREIVRCVCVECVERGANVPGPVASKIKISTAAVAAVDIRKLKLK